MKISAKDVTKWLASHNIKKQPCDLNAKEVEQVATDLKVDKNQLIKLIASTHFDTTAMQTPVKQNKLNGDISTGAVVHYQRGIYDNE